MLPFLRPQKGILRPLKGTSRQWGGVCPGLNGDWYAINYDGSVYKQTGGLGTFDLLKATGVSPSRSVACSSDGTYLLIGSDSDVYMLTLSTLTVAAQGAAGLAAIRGVSIHPNGDWYVSTVGSGGIWVRVGGAGAWQNTSAPVASYSDVACGASGNVYGASQDIGVMKRTAGAGLWSTLDATVRNYTGIDVFSGGSVDDVYASVSGGVLYKSAGGVAFAAVTSENKTWQRLKVDQKRTLVAPEYNGDLHKALNGF